MISRSNIDEYSNAIGVTWQTHSLLPVRISHPGRRESVSASCLPDGYESRKLDRVYPILGSASSHMTIGKRYYADPGQ